MSNYINIALTAVFGVIGVVLFARYFKVRNILIVQDKMWNFIRIMFGTVEIFILIDLITTSSSSRSTLDWIRIVVMIITCTAFMFARDGLAQEGLVHQAKLVPWNIVRAWDMRETSKQVEVYFTIESQNAKKPDEYKTIELDFDKGNKEQVEKFLNINLGRKKTRMKRKK